MNSSKNGFNDGGKLLMTRKEVCERETAYAQFLLALIRNKEGGRREYCQLLGHLFWAGLSLQMVGSSLRELRILHKTAVIHWTRAWLERLQADYLHYSRGGDGWYVFQRREVHRLRQALAYQNLRPAQIGTTEAELLRLEHPWRAAQFRKKFDRLRSAVRRFNSKPQQRMLRRYPEKRERIIERFAQTAARLREDVQATLQYTKMWVALKECGTSSTELRFLARGLLRPESKKS